MKKERDLLTLGVAILAAVLAAGSTVTVAVITSRSSSSDVKAQISRDETVERRDAIGASRVLIQELVTVEVYLQGALDTGRLLPWVDRYDVEVPQADLKRIASSPVLGVDRWQRVSAALSNLETLGSYVRDRYGSGVRKLGPGEEGVFKLDIAAIDNALDALGILAGTPKIRQDPFGAG